MTPAPEARSWNEPERYDEAPVQIRVLGPGEFEFYSRLHLADEAIARAKHHVALAYAVGAQGWIDAALFRLHGAKASRAKLIELGV